MLQYKDFPKLILPEIPELYKLSVYKSNGGYEIEDYHPTEISFTNKK